jgi:hypothetical protein
VNARHQTQFRRKALMEVEKILHPNFKLGEIEILHEHLHDGRLRFTAWKGNDPFTPDRAVTMGKVYVTEHKTNAAFYEAYRADWEFLAEAKNATLITDRQERKDPLPGASMPPAP